MVLLNRYACKNNVETVLYDETYNKTDIEKLESEQKLHTVKDILIVPTKLADKLEFDEKIDTENFLEDVSNWMLSTKVIQAQISEWLVQSEGNNIRLQQVFEAYNNAYSELALIMLDRMER